MSTNVLEREQQAVMTRMDMPPPVLFRNIDELRSRHRIGAHGRELVLHAFAAIASAAVVFIVLYASMLSLGLGEE